MRAIPERVEEIERLHLRSGNHVSWSSGACIMEAVAYVAGEEHSDHPICACPVLSSFLRRWNDDLDDETRQRLKPYIPRLVGSKGTKAIEAKRAWLLTDWMVRVHTPAWLDLGGMPAQAAALRALPDLCSASEARAAQPALEDAWTKAAAARVAAWAAAGDAARAAAGDAARAAAGVAAGDAARVAAWVAAWAAAGDAAGDAARAAARVAAWAAAWDAAWDAAGVAAWVAARAAAGDAAWAKLKPTVVLLQSSAFALLDRMIEVRQ